MALKKVDSITVSTRFGNSQIELLMGDITKLALEDQVDIVMTSAFRGDYSDHHTSTLMGALSRNLGISVQHLSFDKEIDLRKHFSCWVSKPLLKKIPFGRLVCFERNMNSEAGTIAEQISLVFRAMMPICNNHDTTIITPLLATGMQNRSPPQILKAMVEGACQWIQAGLPLKCLKLVLFTNNDQIRVKDEDAVKMFTSLKDRWTTKQTEHITEVKKNDVFISYHEGDESFVNQILSCLKSLDSNLTIFSRQISYHKESVWQEEIFHEMTNSKRIIIVLTAGYVESAECLEQFNMALCCNRQQDKDIVFPFYLQTVSSLPAYMQLVQYVDCRERKDGDVTLTKIKNACNSLLTSEQDAATIQPSDTSDRLEKKPENENSTNQTYDVFISYSHKHESMAKHFLHLLEEKDSDLNVFYDRTDLKMGSRWQDTLYGGICSSKCIVALVTKTYFESTVCCEEYNVAAARFLAHNNMYFLPVCIADMESVPPEYGKIKMVDCRTDTEAKLEQIAEKSIKLSRKGITDSLFSEPSLKIKPYQVIAEYRKHTFEAKYDIKNGCVCRKEVLTKEVNSKAGDCDIVFSFSFQSLKFAAVFSKKMVTLLPDVKCIFLSEHRSQRLQLLDSAKYIVIFVSSQYSQSPQQMEELHLALCRQRAGANRKLVYLIQCRKSVDEPFYLQLLPYSVCLDDTLWKKTAISLVKNSYSAHHTVKMTRETIQGTYTCTLSEYLALSMVCLDIEENHLSSSTASQANIVSVIKMHLKNENVDQDSVTLSECFQDKPLTMARTATADELKTDKLWNDVLDESTSTKFTREEVEKKQMDNYVKTMQNDSDLSWDRLSELSNACHD
ncbi:uncharacterized protein LOC121371556 isoform X2 [Gigantopelta aegis]|nr:uncharacterized protein LOC121371556 isoform X2 [Gigantopelta aegis]